jgi:phosphoesterase RecJ-like protein
MEFESLRKAIENAATIVLTTHLNPDGDALGSEVALACALRTHAPSVRIVNDSETPQQYRFLERHFPLEAFSTSHDALLAGADLIIVLDANQLSRLGSMEASVRRSRATKVCIDHHPTPEPFAEVAVIDESTAATGQIIHSVIMALFPGEMTAHVASALYVALMTDTGSFRFPKTDAKLFRTVASLVEAGADPVALYDRVYNSGTVNRLQLLGKILSTLTTAHDGRVASLRVTRSMFEETKTDESDTENMINHALSIEGVEIALLFSEIPGWVKISFRSKGDIPVNALAREFGGNGHTNAAGARIENGDLGQIIGQVTARSRTYLQD